MQLVDYLSLVISVTFHYDTWAFCIRYDLDFGEVKKEKEMDKVSF